MPKVKQVLFCIALVTLLVGCECVKKPKRVHCLDGWGDTTYRQYVNKCEQKDGVTTTEYGTRTGDCSCSYVHREDLCEGVER
jgi:hypothetical protein